MLDHSGERHCPACAGAADEGFTRQLAIALWLAKLSANGLHAQVQLMRSNHMTSATLLEEVESELSKVRHSPTDPSESSGRVFV